MFCSRTRWSKTYAPTSKWAIPQRYWTETSTDSSRPESVGATHTMTNSTVFAMNMAASWHGFWQGNLGVWILDRGVRIALLLIGGLLAARFINWTANRVVRRIDAQYRESDQLVRSESTKHRQAVASVISWVSVALLFVIVIVEVTDVLA